MKKILFAANEDSNLLDFYLPYLKYCKNNGYEVHVLTNSDGRIPYCDQKIKLDIKGKAWLFGKGKAISKARKMLKTEKYSVIFSCSFDMNVILRYARKRQKFNVKVITIMKGFPFDFTSSKLTVSFYYRLEKKLAKYADYLIFLNRDDYYLAKKNFKKCENIRYLEGTGIKTEYKMMYSEDKDELREKLGLENTDFVLLCDGDLTNENHQLWLIKALNDLFQNNPDFHLLLVGIDKLNGACQKLVKEYGLTRQIHFLGFRDNIEEILQVSDVSIYLAIKEGFPYKILRAMCIGIPIVATETKGTNDVISPNLNGYLIEYEDKDELCLRLTQLYNSPELVKKMQDENKKYVKNFDYSEVYPKIIDLIEE